MPTPESQKLQRLIVGMPRAATTWLCRCLNEHPDTCAFGESLYWGRYYVEPQGSDGRYTPEQVRTILQRMKSGECVMAVVGDGPGYLRTLNRSNLSGPLDDLYGNLPKEPTPAELFEAICHMVGRAEGKPIVVEKTPHHIDWLDRIMTALPGARVVVMLREPYGFLLSWKHQGDRQREAVRKQYARRYHPLAGALIWRSSMKAATSAARRYPESIILVHHEHVRNAAGRILDSVQDFFQLPTHVPGEELAAKIPSDDNTSFPQGGRPTLKPEDIFWMNIVAGGMMSSAGYEKRAGAFAPLRVIYSILRLPVWAIWNLFSMKRRVRGSIFVYLFRRMKPSVPSRTSGAHS